MELVKRNVNGTEILIDTHSSSTFLIAKNQSTNFMPTLLTKTSDVLKAFSQGVDYIPLHCRLEITSLCNLNCEFCYIHNHTVSQNLSFYRIKPYLDYLISQGLLFVVISGGECTLNPEFPLFYSYLKKQGVFVEVYTNAVALSSNILKLFNEYRPYKIEVSLYNDDTNSAVYHNLRLMQANGLNVVAKCTVNRATYAYFYKIQKWCSENNCPFYFSTDVFDAYDGTDMSRFELTAEEKAEIYHDSLNHSNVHFQSEGKTCFECAAGLYSFTINSNYEIQPCSKVGWKINLLNHYPDSALSRLKEYIFAFKGIKISGCYNCRAEKFCKMCFARATVNEGTHSICVNEEYCRKVLPFFDTLIQNSQYDI